MCVCVVGGGRRATCLAVKKTFFVQILGGEKLLKFVEKCR